MSLPVLITNTFKLWLDAQNATSAPPQLDNTAFATWVDVSGSGFNAATTPDATGQITSFTNPKYRTGANGINGFPAIQFDGLTTELGCGSNLNATTIGASNIQWTAYCVFYTASANYQTIWTQRKDEWTSTPEDTIGRAPQCILYNSAGELPPRDGSTCGLLGSVDKGNGDAAAEVRWYTQQSVMGTPHLAVFRFTQMGSNGVQKMQFWLDGVRQDQFAIVANGTGASDYTGGAFHIGNAIYGQTGSLVPHNMFSGLIGELIIANVAHTDADRRCVQSFVGTKWKVPIAFEVPLISDGLISFWNEDDASAANPVDSYGGNNLTSSGATSVAGKILNALGADAAKYQYIVDNMSLRTGPRPFTWTCWMYVNNVTVDLGTAIARYNADAGPREMVLTYRAGSTNKLQFGLYNGSTAAGLATVLGSFGAFSNTTWYFVRAWFDPTVGTNGTAYLQINNGNIDAVALSAAMPVLTTGANTTIGQAGTPSVQIYPLAGRVDMVGYWQRVLTTQEASQLYNSANGIQWGPFPASKNEPYFSMTSNPVPVKAR